MIKKESKGINPQKWGKIYWDFFFGLISFSYPEKLDYKDRDHIKKKKSVINFFNSMRYMLPCYFCRKSYCQFYLENDIEKFSGSRKNMIRWLYIMKDNVNKKLLVQGLNDLMEKTDNGELKTTEFKKEKKKLVEKYTSPPLKKVLEKYLKN